MEHVAIDLGGRESQICIRCAAGEIVGERRVLTASLPRFLGRHRASRVVLETCAEAFAIADAALAAGHEVRVVPSILVRALGVGSHDVKTDQRDARNLSAASVRMDLPSVHIPSEVSRERKSICGMRDALVSSRTQLINTVRGWMRRQTIRPRTGKTETFVARVRETLGASIPSYVERQLQTIATLDVQILQADRELEEIAKKDSNCNRLMTVPGVGPVTSIRFCAAVDQAARFSSSAQLQSYLGLTPGENSSSDRQRKTGITKAGPAALRWTLMQAAWAATRSRGKHPMLEWFREVEKRRGKRVAIVALARKLGAILFAILRDGTFYDPTHSAPREEPRM
jgi:transposase